MFHAKPSCGPLLLRVPGVADPCCSLLLFPFQLLNYISNPGDSEALLRHLARFVPVFNPSVIFIRSFMLMWNFNSVDRNQTDNVLFIGITVIE